MLEIVEHDFDIHSGINYMWIRIIRDQNQNAFFYREATFRLYQQIGVSDHQGALFNLKTLTHS